MQRKRRRRTWEERQMSITQEQKLSLLAELRASEAKFRTDAADEKRAAAVETLQPDRKAVDTLRVCGQLADERAYLAELVARDLGQKKVIA
jgi:hypothetical protein